MINLSIITPEGVLYEDAVSSVTVPTKNGEITILPNHAPLFSLLSAGEMIIFKPGHQVPLVVSSGILKIKDNTVEILAETAERAEEIDITRAEAAKVRAEEMIRERGKIDDVQFAVLQAKLEKELSRIKIFRKHRKIV